MKRKKKRRRPKEEASYVCDACGEDIVVPVDLSAGESQEYVEDCPVCCRPNNIHVENAAFHLTDMDHREYHVVAKDGEGKVYFDVQGTVTRRK